MPSTQNRVVVYINGVRFFPQAVSVSAQNGAFCSFTVSVPAVREWSLLPKRSHAAVFFVDPVSRGWRLMCEGEYVGFNRSKTGEGTRSRTLHFEGLHNCMASVPYVNMAGVATQSGDAATQFLRARANGQVLTGSEDAQAKLVSISAIVDRVSAESTRVSAALPAIITEIIQQTPIESFYMTARKWHKKLFAFEDHEVAKLVETTRWRDMIKNGFAALGIAASTKMLDVVMRFMGMAMYQFRPVLAPPLSKEFDGIFETLMTPQLLFVVPPACNVIFRDQIATQSQSVNFRMLPTRVLTTLDIPEVAPDSYTPYHIANGDFDDELATRPNEKSIRPGEAVTHSLFSREELDMGVILSHKSLSIDRVNASDALFIGDAVKTAASMDDYITKHTRTLFEEVRSQPVQQQLHCSFLPYVVPGFPIVVEDTSGPSYGIVDSVTHQFAADGTVATLVSMSHTREVYTTTGKNRTPYYPLHLNAKFLPAEVDDTYRRIFGANRRGHAAMAPKATVVDQVTTTAFTNEKGNYVRIDLDKLIGEVVEVPDYDVTSGVSKGMSEGAIASDLRAAGVHTHEAMLEYQFRDGTSLHDFVKYHGLWPVNNTPSIDEGSQDPPIDLAPDTAGNKGAALFGAPYALEFDPKNPDKTWGQYTLRKGPAGVISDERQKFTRMILRAVNEQATEG